MRNILKKADQIINERSEEKEREYGPMDKSITDAAKVASVMCGFEVTPETVFKVMIAVKIARLGHSYKEDSMLDMVAYAGALDNYMQQKITAAVSCTYDMLSVNAKMKALCDYVKFVFNHLRKQDDVNSVINNILEYKKEWHQHGTAYVVNIMLDDLEIFFKQSNIIFTESGERIKTK